MVVKGEIKRLLQYRLCLIKFRESGHTRIYSHDLGNEAGVSPEQVRKDFSIHGIKGNKKAGYQIGSLLEILNRIFAMEVKNNVIVVGMGNVGKALSNYNNRHIGQNVYLAAAFDIDPSKHKEAKGVPVYPMEKIPESIQEFSVSTAIITVPASAAQEVCDILVKNGIRGILNFTPMVLKTPDNVLINNINLSTEIEAILYYLNQNKDNN